MRAHTRSKRTTLCPTQSATASAFWARSTNLVAQCGRLDSLSDSDLHWLRRLLKHNQAALDVPFQPTFVHHDFTASNVVVHRTSTAWTLSGVFDLMEAYVGDPEEDLVRALFNYSSRQPGLARDFLRAYICRKPLREDATGRLRLYMLRDCLLIWEFGHRFGKEWVASAPGFRQWAEPLVGQDFAAIGRMPRKSRLGVEFPTGITLTAGPPMLDFTRSFITWTTNPRKPHPYYRWDGGFVGDLGDVYRVRMQVDSTMDIISPSGSSITHYLNYPCRAELTIATEQFFMIPSGEWRAVFTREHGVPIARGPSDVPEPVARRPCARALRGHGLPTRHAPRRRTVSSTATPSTKPPRQVPSSTARPPIATRPPDSTFESSSPSAS